MFVDVHAHLNNSDIPDDFIVVNNGLNFESNKKSLELSKQNKNIKCAMGLYPLEGIKLSEEEINKNIDFIRKHKNDIIAIGEIGLDFKFNKDNKQIEIFKKMLGLAEELNKPVIVHSRGAEKEVLDILKKFSLNVVMHCFSGDLDLINKKCYYSVPVSVVERKWVQELTKKISINKILTESDSPYINLNGMKSKPEDVKIALKKIAKLKELDLDKIKDTIFDNFNTCFYS